MSPSAPGKGPEEIIAPFRDFLEVVPDAMLVVHRDGRILLANRKAGALFGYRSEELSGQLIEILLPERYRKQHPEQRSSFFASRGTRPMGTGRELFGLRKDGTEFRVDISLSPLDTGNGLLAVAAVRDATERVQVEESRRKDLEETFRQFAENVREVLWLASPDGTKIHYVSPAFEQIFGRPCRELYENPLSWREMIHPDDRAALTGKIGTHDRAMGPVDYEFRIVRTDGTIRCIRARGFPVKSLTGDVYRLVGIAEDITEQKDLQRQLVQAQKMEAVGRLSGGIAHDFNNLLTAINGYSHLVLSRLDPRDPLRQDVEEICKAGERAAALTRQLLAFSRRQVLQPRVLQINQVVASMDRLLRGLIGENITLNTVLAPGIGNVRVDPGQLEQVIANLVVNAHDAMPEGGTLTLETSSVLHDGRPSRLPSDLTPGSYVMLTVTDTGTGMTEEVKAHLFEPFFTTKEPGKGTGLGLATVHGIVKQSHGHIAVESKPGGGTTFQILLPRVDTPSEPLRKVDRPREEAAQRGGETILLVEDDEVARQLSRTVLSKAGYTVLAARQGEEALQIAERLDGTIHLLLSDMVMPGMDVLELSRRLANLRPGLRKLYISGYMDAETLEKGIQSERTPFLPKPFTPEGLLHKVRDVLDS